MHHVRTIARAISFYNLLYNLRIVFNVKVCRVHLKVLKSLNIYIKDEESILNNLSKL